MIVYLRLFKESFSFAMNALRNNKLRTLLSLLGITIGIFSIIAVLAAVDSLDRKIKKDLSSLDKNTVYIAKFTFGPSEVPRWKREQFPEVTYEEYEYLKTALPKAKQLGFQLIVSPENIKYDTQTVSSVNIICVTHEFVDIQGLEFSSGRFYSESESNSGAQVVVIGAEIANSLFEDVDPIGKEIRLYGQRFQVIGVLKKQGQGLFGQSNDTSVYVPANYIRRRFGDSNDNVMHMISISPEKDIDIDEFKADVTQKLRNRRGLKPGEIDNFFVSVLSGVTDMLDEVIGNMNIMGWIIAGFSLLVGGFGIANIMFVSVKERTNLIGIQKSLGAKNKFILFQFLFEAIILCLFGGAIGLFLVWIITVLLTQALDFEFVLSFGNIMLGTSLAAVIGLIAGILPAISASKLDPVEAIRSGF
ncbi:MAG: ABC transporter permease [Bacteroidota bacterium]